jgi:hypothetical protein
MKNKIIIAGITIILIFSLVILVLNLSVFSDGELYSKKGYTAIQPSQENFMCEQFQNVETTNLIIHIRFEYPFIFFNGKLIIMDYNIMDSKGYNRSLYCGWFKKKIEIQNICYEAGKPDINLTLLFLTEHKLYSWHMYNSLPLLKYEEIELVLKCDEKINKNEIVVRPLR